ncbi:tetratricopeptide repeat protein [bacterium]|nr:tetratricopeptide repeat protein [bacterium]
MTFVIIVAAVIAAGAAFWYVGARRARSRGRKLDESPYHLGLDALIAGDRDGAMKLLTQAVRDNPRNVDAYIKLGNILRERGQVRQAIQIHRELLVKRKLPTAVRSETIKSLARDLAAAGRWLDVLEHLATLPRGERSDPSVIAMTRDAYESAGDLDKAAQTHKELLKAGSPENQPTAGIYRAHLGLVAFRRGDTRRAKAEFQAAVKEDPDAALAYVYLGDIAVREEDAERAVAYWMRLVSERPGCAHLVFERLEKAYFEIGDFGRMMGIYEQLVASSPSNVMALTGLSRMLERKGAVDEALRIAREAVKHEGSTFEGHRQLIEILMRHERYEEAARAAETLLAELSDHREERTCPSCAAPLDGYDWRCSSCRAWTNEC